MRDERNRRSVIRQAICCQRHDSFHSWTFRASSSDSGMRPVLLMMTSTRPSSVRAEPMNASKTEGRFTHAMLRQ